DERPDGFRAVFPAERRHSRNMRDAASYGGSCLCSCASDGGRSMNGRASSAPPILINRDDFISAFSSLPQLLEHTLSLLAQPGRGRFAVERHDPQMLMV